MKFEIKKSVLQNLFKKVSEVSTKGIKADFDKANRACIVAEQDKLIFTATNGHLDYRTTVTASSENGLVVKQGGKVVAQSIASLPVANSIGGSNLDAVIEVSDTDSGLLFRNVSAKRKEEASVETMLDCKDVDISKPRKPEYSVSFDVAKYSQWARIVLPYVSTRGYKLRYQMLCLHLLPDKVRFVAGDGSRFGVLTAPVKGGKDVKLLLPEDQMQIILSVISDANQVNFDWTDKQTCYISTDNNQEMNLHGIPDLEYIAYEVHAFKEDQARWVVDFEKPEFMNAMGLMGSVRDEEYEKSGGMFHSAIMSVSCDNGEVEFKVQERRKSAKTIQANVYKRDTSVGDFTAAYAYQFLSDAARMSGDYIRFYLISESGVLIAAPVILGSDKDNKNIPIPQSSPDLSEMKIFFASVKEKSSNE